MAAQSFVCRIRATYAQGDPGAWRGMRTVEVPDYDPNWNDETLLERIFYWGQNDCQPQDCPSLSVGDLINARGRVWEVLPVGFRQHTSADW